MNSTESSLLLTITPVCDLKKRVYTVCYITFKFLNSNYLRILIGPGILLNTLCLIVLSRPRLSNKSTTIFFLRFLAIFDILAITLKYIRVEINHQSTVNHKHIFFITDSFCKAFYVCMGACISISIWTTVLMSVDKAIAVIYPLKSSIWLTQKRASYMCYLASLILFLANMPFISFAKQSQTASEATFCGLDENKNPVVHDMITASILPIALITAANIVIAVTLHRISRKSFNWSTKEKKTNSRNSEAEIGKNKRLSKPCRNQGSPTSSINYDTTQAQASKRRASAQVTRMLFAVTVSIILFYIPNIPIFLYTRQIETKSLLRGRPCITISNEEISLYQIGFYLSVVQDILSDLPHIVNFFLYCLTGKKFRSILFHEIRRFLVKIHLIKQKQNQYNNYTHMTSPESINISGTSRNQRRVSSRNSLLQSKQTINVLFNGTANKLILCEQDYNKTVAENVTYDEDHVIRIYSKLH